MFAREEGNPSVAREPVEAVLLDALGTLVDFDDPAPRLADSLGVPLADAQRAVRAEIAYYRAHLHLGADAAGLAVLRARCAEIVRRELALRLPTGFVLGALLDAIVFEAYPDAAPALRELRAAGLRLVVVSNWDVSLHEALRTTGLSGLVDAAVASAEVGSAKPDGLIFIRGLELAGVPAARAAHVGDSPEADVEGARRAGIAPVLIARDGGGGAGAIRSLVELPRLIAAYAGPDDAGVEPTA